MRGRNRIKEHDMNLAYTSLIRKRIICPVIEEASQQILNKNSFQEASSINGQIAAYGQEWNG